MACGLGAGQEVDADDGGMYDGCSCRRHLKRLLAFSLISVAALGGSGALACERHLNSQQNTTSVQDNTSQPANGDPKSQVTQK